MNRRTQGSNRFPQSKPAIADHSSWAILARSRVRRRSSPAYGIRRTPQRSCSPNSERCVGENLTFQNGFTFPPRSHKAHAAYQSVADPFLIIGQGSPSGLPPVLKATRHRCRHRRRPKREGDHPYVSYIHELCFKFKGSFRHPGGTCKPAVRRHLRESAPFRRNPDGKTHNINRQSVFPDRKGREKGE